MCFVYDCAGYNISIGVRYTYTNIYLLYGTTALCTINIVSEYMTIIVAVVVFVFVESLSSKKDFYFMHYDDKWHNVKQVHCT